MAVVRIEINTRNAAFGDRSEERGAEVIRILRDLCKDIEEDDPSPGDMKSLFDVNGNSCGKYTVTNR